MTKLKWNPNNTEGHWPTSFDFIDTEIRKDDKIVATDLVDLYDVDVSGVTDGKILVYDSTIQKWVPGDPGASCEIIETDTIIKVGTGEQFETLNECFVWLRDNCKVIKENATLTISLQNSLEITEDTNLNHPYGHRIIINGHMHTLKVKYDIEFNTIYENVSLKNYIISNGRYFTIICNNNHHHIKGAGYNQSGQLGTLYTNDKNFFVNEYYLNNDWKYIFTGYYHTLAIKEDGTLWATGSNNKGQLGLGNLTDKHIFTQINNDTDWFLSAGGSRHTLALKEDGTLWATGWNSSGQLGLGDNSDRNTFTQVGTDTDWKQVACGNRHTLALKEDGTLWATGWNASGQLGLGNNTDRNTFTQVGTDTDWKQVICNEVHTLAIKEDGTLWATGYNYYGQLGLGDNSDRNTFTQVGTDTDWKQVACGEQHTIAIKNNGTLWATGWNSSGQLGLGNNSNRNTFTQVGTDTDWKQVACGGSHTLAIKEDGILWGTGNNYYGQLGLKDNNNRNVFTELFIEELHYYINNFNTNKRLILDSNHTIHNIKNVKFNIILNHIQNTNANEILLNNTEKIIELLTIRYNSSTVFKNCYFYNGDSGSDYYDKDNGLKSYTINIKDNSLIIIKDSYLSSLDGGFYLINGFNIENNSSFIIFNIIEEINNIILKNKSTFIYDNLKNGYNYIVNINSKIFRKK